MIELLLLLTELMPDPEGADNNHEYLEFSVNGSLANLTFTIIDEESNDTLTHVATIGNTTNATREYLLVVEEGYAHANLTVPENTACHVYSAGAAIGNGLSNEHDTIRLLATRANETAELANHTYTVDGCAAGDGCALNTTSTVAPTPCAPAPRDEEVGCPLTLAIEAATIHDASETITYTPLIAPAQDEYTITYWWEDLYGETVKEPRTTTNDDEKRYTPRQPDGERDWGLLAKMTIENGCNTTNATAAVIIRGDEPVREEEEDHGSGSGGAPVQASEEAPPALAFTNQGTATAGEPLAATATLYNDAPIAREYNVSIYLYRHSVNYTPRTPRPVTIGARSYEAVEQALTVDEPGEYSLKARVYTPGRKTPYEETRTVTLTAPPQPARQPPAENESVEEEPAPPLATGYAIEEYAPQESWSDRLAKNSPWLSALLAGGLFFLARKR